MKKDRNRLLAFEMKCYRRILRILRFTARGERWCGRHWTPTGAEPTEQRMDGWIYIYMYVYVYIYVYIHIYTYIYMYIYTCMYMSTYMYIYTYMYVYMYIYMHIYL